MKIEEILLLASTDAKEAVKQLKSTTIPVVVDEYVKQLDPNKHKVMDTVLRPDRELKEDGQISKTILTGRVPLALQTLIVNRAVAFLFGIDPKIKGEPENDLEIQLFNAVKKVLNISKSKTINSLVAVDMFSCTQAGEMWYPTKLKEKANFYGFDSDSKLKVFVFSPLRGDNFYPLFDEFGDLVAFSREYSVKNLDGSFKYLEVYTETKIMKFDVSKDPILVDGSLKDNPIGIIPVVFDSQVNVEWFLVQSVIERLETLMSNFADTNDYNGSPILFVKGALKTMPAKESSGKLLVGTGDGADAKYVSWEQAPESIKLEIENLFNIVYGFTQTPNISFEMVKGIGSISGIALKLLFMDAHLKVQAKRRIFDTYLIRRINIIKAWLCILEPKFKAAKNMFIEAEIIPYTIIDYKELYEYLTIANGNQPVISQETSIGMTGEVDNIETELDKIVKETKARELVNAFPGQE